MTGINNSPIIQMNVKHYLTTGLQRQVSHTEEHKESSLWVKTRG